MEKIERQYLIEKQRSESPEDLIGKFLFRLIALHSGTNEGLNGLNERQHGRHNEMMESNLKHNLTKENLLAEIKKAINGKEIDLSQVLEVLSQILDSNSALGESFGRLGEQHPEMMGKLDEIAELTAKNKPSDVVFDKLINSNQKGISTLGELIVKLTEGVKTKKFPDSMKIAGPVEIKEPKWWKPFNFSLEPIKELFEKLKDHTFSVKVENKFKFDESIFKNFPDDVAKKLAKVLEKELPKIRISGGGGIGNPFTFDDNGNLKVSSTGGSGGGAATIADGNDVTLGAKSDVAITSDSAGTISGKLRGLVKILASVWDSAHGRIKVDGSGVTQPVELTNETGLAKEDTLDKLVGFDKNSNTSGSIVTDGVIKTITESDGVRTLTTTIDSTDPTNIQFSNVWS